MTRAVVLRTIPCVREWLFGERYRRGKARETFSERRSCCRRWQLSWWRQWLNVERRARGTGPPGRSRARSVASGFDKSRQESYLCGGAQKHRLSELAGVEGRWIG